MIIGNVVLLSTPETMAGYLVFIDMKMLRTAILRGLRGIHFTWSAIVGL